MRLALLSVFALVFPSLATAQDEMAPTDFDPADPITWRGTWVTVRGEKLTIDDRGAWTVRLEGVGATADDVLRVLKVRGGRIAGEVTGTHETKFQISALSGGQGLWLDSNMPEGFVSQRLYPLEGVQGLALEPEADLWGGWVTPFWDRPISVSFAQDDAPYTWRFAEKRPDGTDCMGTLVLKPDGRATTVRNCADQPPNPALTVGAGGVVWEGHRLVRPDTPRAAAGQQAALEGADKGSAGERVRIDGSFSVLVPEGFSGEATQGRIVLTRGDERLEMLPGPYVDAEGFAMAWTQFGGSGAGERLEGGLQRAIGADKTLYNLPLSPERSLFGMATGFPEPPNALLVQLATTVHWTPTAP